MSAGKIVSLENAVNWIDCTKAENWRKSTDIVLAHGVFDLLHPGHVRHLEEAKAMGEVLVVSVTRDADVCKGPGRPVFNQDQRAEMLAALQCVDAVVVNPYPTAAEIIAKLKPDIYVKGRDYKDGGHGIEHDQIAAESVGCQVKFTESPLMSSSEIINQNIPLGDERQRGFLRSCRERDFRRHVPALIERAKDLSVLFIGETIIDEYAYVAPLGKPPKEWCIASLLGDSEQWMGGIQAAANTARDFVGMVSVLSDRSVVKRRYVDRDFNRKLFEIYKMTDEPPAPDQEQQIIAQIAELAPVHDVTVVIDFGHGMMTPAIRKAVMTYSKFLAVNAQSNSANHGFNPVTKYKADYICIDAPEAKLACLDKRADLITCAHHLKAYAPKVVITDGRRGCVVPVGEEYVTVPALADKVVDTIGAGDAFLAWTAPLVSLTDDLELTSFIGNIAGAIKCGIPGHRRNVRKDEVLRYAESVLK